MYFAFKLVFVLIAVLAGMLFLAFLFSSYDPMRKLSRRNAAQPAIASPATMKRYVTDQLAGTTAI